jgi:HSP20 family molecular chaperone IbpA
MTNALDFFGTKDLFDFGFNPIKTFFGDFVPANFTNSPKVNVKETDKAYEIEIANPGFGKDDTKIEENPKNIENKPKRKSYSEMFGNTWCGYGYTY